MRRKKKPNNHFSPIMTAARATLMPLLAEVVQVLADSNAYWNKCGGAGTRTGLSFDDLLTTLQWTSSLLASILQYGLKLGTLRQSTVGPRCLTGIESSGQYFVNTNMLYENNANTYFLSVLPWLHGPTTSVRFRTGYQIY